MTLVPGHILYFRYLRNILSEILKNEKQSSNLVKDFQEQIWGMEDDNDEFKILTRLAYDLDFYEPDSEMRKESSSFFDEKKMKELVKEALEKLNEKQQY